MNKPNACGSKVAMNNLRDLASVIRSMLTMEQVVNVYLPDERVRKGFVRCPFHVEKTGSLRIYENTFYCFGCHQRGDAIDFVGRLFNLRPMEAVRRINEDFQLNLLAGNASLRQKLDIQRRCAELSRQRVAAEESRQRRKQAFEEATDLYTSALIQMRDNAPTDQDAPYPAKWIDAAKRIDLLAYELTYFDFDAEKGTKC